MSGIAWLTDEKVRKASALAARVHWGQRRKGDGTEPYIAHPFRVALCLARAGLSPEAVAAGLLHDAIEETPRGKRGALRKELARTVGQRVLDLVEGVTDQDPEADWYSRKDAYLEHLKIAPREALAVSCADKLDNTLGLLEVIETQGREGLKRFNSPIGTKIAYHQAVADVTERRWPDCPILHAFREALAKLQAVADATESGKGGEHA